MNPKPPIPKIQSLLVSVHLSLYGPEVGRGGLLRGRLERCQVSVHTTQESPLELQEIGIDAHPVAGIFPASRSDVLALERMG
jgi:hypothetical protein